MKAQALLTMKAVVKGLWIFSLLTICPSQSQAEGKSLDKVLKHEELVLTLSDDVLMTENEQSTSLMSGQRKINQSNSPQKKPVDLGCGMDLSPFGTTSDNDSSMSSRLIGECNLNYKY